jgi:hypothetical protein
LVTLPTNSAYQYIRDILKTKTVKNETFSKKSKNSMFGQILPILATFYKVKITFGKKLVGGATKTDLFDKVFGIYMLWGIQKQ